MATLIDTNIILRYLLADDQEMYEQAVAVIRDGAYALPESIVEVVYVLTEVYSLDRERIAQSVNYVLQDIRTDRREEILEAIETFRTSNLDYVDCLYAAIATSGFCDFMTFDKKLMAYIKKRKNSDA
ncbi:MAG TPA: PIN domain-containing protein [Sphaerochaeta sp.]|nr:type II toxin-antitoxin system VapC family toxin [Spirochaetales bacterium]HPX29300.1 PIN domain-containing protein [Sphaerochaeta sp.]HQB54534.1 PIN domain-containing protein [Sphaerochaeta sp.]